jgi:hypothetical protein
MKHPSDGTSTFRGCCGKLLLVGGWLRYGLALFHFATPCNQVSKSERNQITTASDIFLRLGAFPSETSFRNVERDIPQYAAACFARNALGSIVSFAISNLRCVLTELLEHGQIQAYPVVIHCTTGIKKPALSAG